MDLTQRKRVELQAKLGSLQQEFVYWFEQSEALKPMQKNYTQIRRIAALLAGCNEMIGAQLGDAAQSGQYQKLERMILEVHRIWEFFRSKYLLHQVPDFHEYLLVADEFAWDCYNAARLRAVARPAQEASEPDLARATREPPLTFFNGDSSPFAQARNRSFTEEMVAGETLDTPEFIEILRSLPVPTVGIPWLQIRHLPDALAIGHEVGHVVAADFGLTQEMETRLEAAMQRRQAEAGPSGSSGAQAMATRCDAWKAWLSEVFADLYGTLATGPAFVGGLMDFLATDSSDIVQEEQQAPNWGDYPPVSLRIQLCLELLTQIERQTGACYTDALMDGTRGETVATLTVTWQQIYSSHPMAAFEADIPAVVAALVFGGNSALNGASCYDALCFTPADHLQAQQDAIHLLTGEPVVGDTARSLLATARLAFAIDPDIYKARKAHTKILAEVRKNQKIGTRGETRADSLEHLPDRLLADKEAGRNLFNFLLHHPGKPVMPMMDRVAPFGMP